MRRRNLNTLLNALGVLLLIAVTSTYLYGKENVRIYPIEGSKKANVCVFVPQGTEVVLSVQNIDGTGIYSETISDMPIYQKIYDFTDLDNGLYKIVATVGNVVESNEFEVKNSDIKLNGRVIEYEPSFLLHDKSLIINYLNTENDKIIINMEDNMGTFFTEVYSGNLTFEKAYDISDLPAGYYNVSLSAGNKLYYYNFEVN